MTTPHLFNRCTDLGPAASLTRCPVQLEIQAAHRLPRGRATRADIWRVRDRRVIARQPPSATWRSRASASAWSWSTLMHGTCLFRPSPSTSYSATWPSATSPAAKDAPRRFTKPSGSFAQAARRASSMTALIATPRSSRAREVEAAPPGAGRVAVASHPWGVIRGWTLDNKLRV
jgi:hypothetical protein